MASFEFSVSGSPQQVCVSGSDDRFEVKSVVGGEVHPYRVRSGAFGGSYLPVLIGGNAPSCVTVVDNGDYIIEWSDTLCGDNLPVFTSAAAPVSSSECSISIKEVFGDGDFDSVIGSEFNDVTINNPGCCDVLVETSAGSFTVKAREGGFEKRLGCAVVLTGLVVSGECDKSAVHFIFINDGLG